MSVPALDRLRALIRSEHLAPVIGPAVRAAIGLVVPVAAAQWAGRPDLGLLAALAAFNLTLADNQSPYRLRAVLLGAGTALMTAAALVGTLVSSRPWLAAMLMGLVAGGAGFVRALGQTATSLGLCAWVLTLMSALASPTPPSLAPLHAVLVAAGGLWATLLSFVLWPLHPYQPLYRRLGAAWEAAADLIAAVGAPPGPARAAGPEAGETQLPALTTAVRTAVDDAASALGARRAAAQGSNPVAEAALLLIRSAARLAASAQALDVALETARTQSGFQAAEPAVAKATASIETATRAVATALALGGSAHPPNEAGDRIRSAAAHVDALAGPGGAPSHLGGTEMAFHGVAMALREAVGHLRAAADALDQLRHPPAPARPLPVASPGIAGTLREGGKTLRQHLTPDSMYFRHAVRVGLASSAGVALYTALPLHRGYWIVLTLIVVLQPDFGGTLQRAVQRVVGTVAGAAAGTALMALPLGSILLDLLLAMSCFGFMVFFRRRYGVAVVCITIMLVLLFEAMMPVNWEIAAYRLLDTVLGGALALAAGYALWPSLERQHFPQQMAAAMRANRDFLQRLAAALALRGGATPALAEARRAAEVESGNAAASFQRMLGEPASQRGDVTLGYALVTFGGRMTRELTALASHLPALSPRLALPGLETFAGQVGETLDGLAAALAGGKPLGGLAPFTATLAGMEETVPPLREGGGPPNRPAEEATSPELVDAALVWAQLDKVAREVTGMYLAMGKAHAAGAPPPSSAAAGPIARDGSSPGGFAGR